MSVKESSGYDNYMDDESRKNDSYSVSLDKFFDEPLPEVLYDMTKAKKKPQSDVWKSIYVHFRCQDDMVEFCTKINQMIPTNVSETFYPLYDKKMSLFKDDEEIVTIDPERDTAESIDKYAKGFAEEFMGVRGSRPMLLNLATQLAVNNVMPSHKHMDHSHLDNHVNNIILINPDGKFAGFFRPPFTTPRLSLTYQSVTSN